VKGHAGAGDSAEMTMPMILSLWRTSICPSHHGCLEEEVSKVKRDDRSFSLFHHAAQRELLVYIWRRERTDEPDSRLTVEFLDHERRPGAIRSHE
jgi:hypothetical protein